ncbi:hypothetical protein [Angustibacter aerolatus]
MAMTDRAAWERERAAAERLARAEQARLEKMLERLDARAPSRTRLTAQLGSTRHAVRSTLTLGEWVSYLRREQPARFRHLVVELGPPA